MTWAVINDYSMAATCMITWSSIGFHPFNLTNDDMSFPWYLTLPAMHKETHAEVIKSGASNRINRRKSFVLEEQRTTAARETSDDCSSAKEDPSLVHSQRANSLQFKDADHSQLSISFRRLWSILGHFCSFCSQPQRENAPIRCRMTSIGKIKELNSRALFWPHSIYMHVLQ